MRYIILDVGHTQLSCILHIFGHLASSNIVERSELERNVFLRMIEAGVNAPLTSSAGRLFDGISALLGVREVVRYEGQAAVELEALAAGAPAAAQLAPAFPLRAGADGVLIADPLPVVRGVVDGVLAGESSQGLAQRFHHALAATVVELCLQVRERTGLREVVLSGGVFLNRLLLRSTIDGLENAAFTVHAHERVPTNDGGIALGQALVAAKDPASRRVS